MSYESDIKGYSPESEPVREVARRELAAAYARTFATEDGARVLADLQKKFGHDRPRFRPGSPAVNPLIDAALIDGECHMLREIELAIRAGHGVA